MESLGSSMCAFQREVQGINTRLDELMWKIKIYENLRDENDELSVYILLKSINSLKMYYKEIEGDIENLKSLQNEMLTVVKEKMQNIAQLQQCLQDKIHQCRST